MIRSRAPRRILNAGKKIAILAGRGALGMPDELAAMAERLGAPVIKPLLGKGVVPDDSPYSTGGIGLLGTRPSQEALENCDTLLIVGSRFPYIEYLSQAGRRRVPCRSTSIRSASVCAIRSRSGWSAMPARCLQALLPQLDYREDRSFLETGASRA